MTPQELKDLLRGGAPTGCFLFCGEEGYLKRVYLRQMRDLILSSPEFNTFNHMVREGAEIDLAAVADMINTPAFFAEGKLIEWHTADLSSLTEKKVEQLLSVAGTCTPESGTALVLICTPEGFDPGTRKRPSALAKKLEGAIHIVHFEKSTDAQLLNWLKRHFEHEGVKAEPQVLRAMLSRCGHSMDVLATETDKLTCYAKAKGRDSVTEEDVRLVCCSTTESDAFGLTNALLDRDPPLAYRCLQDLAARRVEPTVILGQISRLYTDLLAVARLMGEGMGRDAIAAALSMNAYKAGLYMQAAAKRKPEGLARALSVVAKADLTAKTTYGTSQYAMLDALVAELSVL